jgi:hypothetical protein
MELLVLKLGETEPLLLLIEVTSNVTSSTDSLDERTLHLIQEHSTD